MTNLIIGLLVTMVFSAFFSGMEIAFVSSNRLRAEMDREKNGLAQRAIDVFYRHPNNFVSTTIFRWLFTVFSLPRFLTRHCSIRSAMVCA